MKLTVGMAHFEDFDGAIFTLQSLIMHHAEVVKELLVVDNSPVTPDGVTLADYCRKAGVRYIEERERHGTSGPRNRIFEEASGDIVVVLDCHVLLSPGALAAVLSYLQDRPACQDLIHGPRIGDDPQMLATHYNNEWRADCWGTWGCDERGRNPHGDAFDIFACGFGAFACRKSAWLGFDSAAYGFGGEEIIAHEEFRRAGRRVLCLPAFRWWHRFARPRGVPYRLQLWDRIRNYVLSHQRLGIPLDRMHEHFVGGGRIEQGLWDYLLADPVNHIEPPPADHESCGFFQMEVKGEYPVGPTCVGAF